MIDLTQYSGLFNSDELKLLAAAFEKAWTTVRASGAYGDGDAESARVVLARYIIEQAQTGERDEGRLSDGAVVHLALRANLNHKKVPLKTVI